MYDRRIFLLFDFGTFLDAVFATSVGKVGLESDVESSTSLFLSGRSDGVFGCGHGNELNVKRGLQFWSAGDAAPAWPFTSVMTVAESGGNSDLWRRGQDMKFRWENGEEVEGRADI